jgi:NAD(P)-dependent dehydrogenase (short-subunit alcohol dehydrogenase family)
MEIQGRSVLITGGSRGLGAALGRALAREGARVVLVARGAEELARVVDEIRAQGGEAHGLVADVGAKEDVHRISGAAAALAGPVDVLVHNASTLGPTPLRLLLDTECEDFGRVLDVNLVGPFRLTRAVAGGMALRGRGLVVHVTSDASVNAYPTWGAYGVSKAGLDHLARIWAAELEGTGVRFMTVDPGEMDTAMHAEAMPDADRAALADPVEVAERVVGVIRSAEGIPSGTRLEANQWAPAPREVTHVAAGPMVRG